MIIIVSFHSIFKNFEVISSVYANYQIMKNRNFPETYVVVENVDEINVSRHGV